MFGGALAMRGRFEEAARVLAASMRIGFIPLVPAYAVYRHFTPRVRAALGAERARALRDEGRAMSLDEARDYLLAAHAGRP
jgi:hypothetical protein